MKKSILIFNEYYLPGYKAGGPIRSISNLVSWLGDEFAFKIVAKDRDSFEEQPYEGIKVNEWNKVGKADVYYMGKDDISVSHLLDLLKDTSYDAVYLNSLWNVYFSIVPLLLLTYVCGFDSSKILLAPRGQLSEGALAQKTIKKKIFLWLIRIIGVHKKILWKATNTEEKKEIVKNIGVDKSKISIASNLPQRISGNRLFEDIEKEGRELKLVYLSRITPKKNLTYALDILRQINNVDIVFDLFGVIDDKKYWNKCKSLIVKMPQNIQVRYQGVINHEDVIDRISKYHLFLFPTKGENFGHAIYEAMVSGTPVLISNQTPWVDLQKKGLGWEFPLDNKEKFINTIKKMGKLDQAEITEFKNKVRQNIHKENIESSAKDIKKIFKKKIS